MCNLICQDGVAEGSNGAFSVLRRRDYDIVLFFIFL